MGPRLPYVWDWGPKIVCGVEFGENPETGMRKQDGVVLR
jgi:hypothetical protein